MPPNGRALRRKALCEYWQVAGHGAGVGRGGSHGRTHTSPALQLGPALLLCCPPAAECHMAAGTAVRQQRHSALPLPLCCLQLCPGTRPRPTEWKRTRLGGGVPSVSTMAVSACQGPFIFLSYVVLSKEVRKALKFACSRKPTPDPALTTKSTLTSVRAPRSDGRGSRPEEPVCSLYFFYLGILPPPTPISTHLHFRRRGRSGMCSLGRKCYHWIRELLTWGKCRQRLVVRDTLCQRIPHEF